MSTILVIQFRINQDLIKHEQVCFQRQLGLAVHIKFISALDETIDWTKPTDILAGFAGIILGGSGDLDFDGNRPLDDVVRQTSRRLLDKLRLFFQYVFDNDIPTLGICYGHQIIGAFAGAEVKYSKTQTKVCSHELKFIVDKSKSHLFFNLPESFSAYYGHKDVLDRLPEGATLLLSGGERCQIPALQYKNNIFTVQFHPELTYLDMIKRIKTSLGYLPEGIPVEEVFKDDSRANLILKNFADFVTLQSASMNQFKFNDLIQPIVDQGEKVQELS